MRKQHIVSLCNLGIALLFIWLTVSSSDIRDWAEFKGYDALMALPAGPQDFSPIVLVDIDNQAMDTFGSWPWPRALLAEGIQKAAALGARLIGLPLLLNIPQESLPKEALAGLAEAFLTTFGAVEDEKLKAFYQTIIGLQNQLDQDRILAAAIDTTGNVAVPVGITDSAEPKADDPENAKAFAERARRVYGLAQGVAPRQSDRMVLPLPLYVQAARVIGPFDVLKDTDGKVRRTRPIYWLHDLPLAAYPLSMAAAYLRIPEKELRMQSDNRLSFNGHRIPLSAGLDFLIRFDPATPAFTRYGFADLLDEKLPPQAFSEKLVLFNFSATGLMPRTATPIDNQMPMGELTAHILKTYLTGEPVCRLPHDTVISYLVVVLIGVFLTFALPRLSLPKGIFISFCIIFVLISGSFYFFFVQRIWIQLMFPAVEVLIGSVITAFIMSGALPTPHDRAEQAAKEILRLKGLSFLAQGQSDDAWEKLRQLQVDDAIKPALYELAINYEKQGMTAKALIVYEHIEAHDAEFRDIQIRMSRLVESDPPSKPDLQLQEDEVGAWPGTGLVPTKLGRYELIRPVGFGAMGTVYLGMDPRIKRETAIKTYRFNEEYEPADAEKMKYKFFREAESAGKLSHPGIVTIFDAGEEGQLAYIAMEFLEGKDLRAHVKKGALLPMRKVVDYVADIAEALAYAHNQGVVHRDIKPANIMLLKNGTVKITDFGIARIIATSKTRTGVVKGTPYYMAPEQITGKKVDGRCDIFSLGVVFFQLLTGQLPFMADNPGALMHKIVHDPHPTPKSINPGIINPVVIVLNKALAKDVTKRYQDAGQMAAHLRQIGQKIDAVIAERKMRGTQDRS